MVHEMKSYQKDNQEKSKLFWGLFVAKFSRDNCVNVHEEVLLAKLMSEMERENE